MADILQGRMPMFAHHQLVTQPSGRPQMQPTRPAQSGGIKTVNEEPTKDALGAKAAAAKGAARRGRQSLHQ
jgi:hypothetical protein